MLSGSSQATEGEVGQKIRQRNREIKKYQKLMKSKQQVKMESSHKDWGVDFGLSCQERLLMM